MTVKEFAERSGFEVICLPSPDKCVSGAYVGDLLSWVMGRAESENVWITIMSNINIVAVAALTDVACVVLAEGVEVDETVLKTAEQKGVNILSSGMTAYGLVKKLAALSV